VQTRLLEFVELCRKNGIRVSTAEALDAVRAVTSVGIDDAATLRGALEATLIKREVDAAPFAELFDLFFFRKSAFLKPSGQGESPPLVEALRQAGFSDEELEYLLAILADEAARMSPLARLGMGLAKTNVEALIRLAGLQMNFDRLQNPLQIGFFSQQLLEQMNFRGATEELNAVEGALARKLGDEKAAAVIRAAKEHLDSLRSRVRGYVKDEFNRRQVQFMDEMRRQILANKPFGTLTERELDLLREEVTRLGRKLRDQASRRQRPRRRGRLDARRTMRRAMATGGVPFRLIYRRRKPDRPSLVVLCDISDSVRHVSRFMLQLAYTLQEMFAQVRSFVFVSDLGECTSLFRDYELHEAVDVAYAGGIVNVYANSNFGRAFAQFADEHLQAVGPRTTVLVIGDGRNNYNAPEAWALAAIAERAKRLVWLNPEPPASWAFGDSAMRDYEPHCDKVESVNDLTSLTKAVDDLLA